ncbi:class I SAM-dependent methyltransferase [Chloroflexi bacterium TSY]|nr:class I SAM-dependent methyltransferase [Chloroflexi bacterium TSY]
MRHFENRSIATRYDNGRPQLHGAIITLFVKEIGQSEPFSVVLDVACGTGHSSEPLMQISKRVIGIDVSRAMIEIARRNLPNVEFKIGRAESLPSDIGPIDAAFVGNGFHWLNKQKFLLSLSHLLSPSGWLAVYGLGSPNNMIGNPIQ